METESYTFTSVGRTADEAVDAMVATMRRHRAQFSNGDKPWVPEDYEPPVHGAPRPDGDDAYWLRYMATEHYGARVVGPLGLGTVGARDGERLR
jgi:hypothetical protein